MSCLFCKIVSGEIPAHKVYEDGDVLAFLDINPINPGHTLIIPKQHCENLLDTKEEILVKMISVTPRIAAAVLKAGNYAGFNLGVNNGAVAGQVVPHLHFHVMPRRENDGHKVWVGKSMAADDLRSMAEAIRLAF